MSYDILKDQGDVSEKEALKEWGKIYQEQDNEPKNLQELEAYRKGYTFEQAYEELKRVSGDHNSMGLPDIPDEHKNDKFIENRIAQILASVDLIPPRAMAMFYYQIRQCQVFLVEKVWPVDMPFDRLLEKDFILP